VKTTDSIAFGFYNGLGDIVSDLPVINEFIQKDFFVEIFVYEWLKDFTAYLFPKASVKTVKNSKDIKNISLKSEQFFLTPNYLHKFSYSKTSFLSYLLKSFLLKTKVKKLIASDAKTVLYYTFDIKKTYLDAHFFDMSYSLIKKHFDICIKEKEKKSSKIKQLCLFPFSGREQKDYPQERFLTLLEMLKDEIDIKVFVQEKDRGRLDKRFFDYDVESKSLTDLTDFLNEEKLVLANDSGPAHLGAIKGAKVIVLYLATDSKKYMPKGDVEALDLRNGLQNSEKMIHSMIKKSLSLGKRQN